jgi:putative transposase
MTEIPTAAREAVPGHRDRPVLPPAARGRDVGLHPDAELAKCRRSRWPSRPAAAERSGPIWREEESERVIFHTDRGSTYTANDLSPALCRNLGIRQSMGRVGSCFDNAAAEAFFSSLEWEVLSRNEFPKHHRSR